MNTLLVTTMEKTILEETPCTTNTECFLSFASYHLSCLYFQLTQALLVEHLQNERPLSKWLLS